MLLLFDSAVSYVSEVLAYDAGTAALDAGFTTVPFLGVDATSVADGIAAITDGANVSAIFRFNNETGLYDSFRAALPASLNGLQELNRGDLLLVQSTAAATRAFAAFTSE